MATLISLAKTEKYRTICTVQRMGDNMPETVLLFDRATRRLTLGGTKEFCDQHDAEQCILEFLDGKEPADARSDQRGRRRRSQDCLGCADGAAEGSTGIEGG
jgi:hypothetical protein